MLGNLQQAVVLPLVGSTARGIASSAAAANIGLMTTPVAAFLLNNRVTTPMNEALMPVNTTERPSNQLAKAPSLQVRSCTRLRLSLSGQAKRGLPGRDGPACSLVWARDGRRGAGLHSIEREEA